MTKRQILSELDKYLTPFHISYLRLSMSTPKEVQFCAAVWRVVQEYNSNQQNEDYVCELLSKLCKIHFK